MTDKPLKLLGLMRRAGAVEIGADRSTEAARAGKARVLLLASEGTIESGIYQKTCETRGIRYKTLQREEYTLLRDCIEAVKRNRYTEDVRDVFLELVHRESVCILGCTELPILYERYREHCSDALVYDPDRDPLRRDSCKEPGGSTVIPDHTAAHGRDQGQVIMDRHAVGMGELNDALHQLLDRRASYNSYSAIQRFAFPVRQPGKISMGICLQNPDSDAVFNIGKLQDPGTFTVGIAKTAHTAVGPCLAYPAVHTVLDVGIHGSVNGQFILGQALDRIHFESADKVFARDDALRVSPGMSRNDQQSTHKHREKSEERNTARHMAPP